MIIIKMTFQYTDDIVFGWGVVGECGEKWWN